MGELMEKQLKEENFESDKTSSGLKRVSCKRCGRAIVCHPYMRNEMFEKEVHDFKLEHECNEDCNMKYNSSW